MTEVPKLNVDPSPPYLEHYPEPGGVPHRIWLDPLPFRIGRSMTAHYITRKIRPESERCSHGEHPVVNHGESYLAPCREAFMSHSPRELVLVLHRNDDPPWMKPVA